MRTYIYLLFCIIIVSSCIKDPVRYNKYVVIDNQVKQNVTLKRYIKNKDSYPTNNLVLKSGEKKEVYAISGSGKVDVKNNDLAFGLSFPADINADSVTVTFNENAKLTVTHLNKQHRVTPRKNLIPFDDARNILNPKNYVVATKGHNYEIVYTFTEKDYLNAK